MKILKKRSRLTITWLLSYGIILLVPVICSLTLFERYSGSMEEQMRELNYYIADTMTNNTKNVLVNMRKYYAEVAFHDELDDVLRVSAHDIGISGAARDFMKWFGERSAYKTSYERAYIYQPVTDTVIAENGIYESLFYYNTYCDSAVISYEDWKSSHYVKDSPYKIIPGAKSVNSIEPEELITYHMALPRDVQRTFGDISFSVVVKKTDIFQRMPENQWLLECDIYLFDNNGRLILADSSAEEMPSSLEELVKAEESHDNIVQINHITYDTSSMSLATVGHRQLIMGEISKIRFLSTFVMIACVLFGVVMAWYFVHRDYKPIKDLMALCGLGEPKDEYSQIKNLLEETFIKNNNLQKIADKYRTYLRTDTLAQLLKGGLSSKKAAAALSEYEIVIYPGRVMVFAFDTEEFRAFLPEEKLSEEQKLVEVRFIISNIFEEIFSTPESSGYVVDVDRNVVCIASHKAQDEEFFERAIQYGLSMIEKYFAMRLTVAMSAFHEGEEMVSVAYNEALYALEYKRLKTLEQSVRFNEIQKSIPTGRHFNMEKEQKLMNLLHLGEKEDTVRFINELFDEIEADKTLSLENIKMLMFDIEATILKTLEMLPEENKQSTGDAVGLLTSSTLESLRQRLLSFVEANSFSVGRGRESAKFEEICRYIEENYADPNLNINSIGAYFEMYPAYLSKLFKNNCGIVMMDYINHYRMARAKELMETTELPIMEVASRVGYGHIRTFNRLFKKYEGITPSIYRRSLKKH